ncbi:MAG TPA: IPTL-CTERM sorting domain-containing protein [Thermoanaerobaculia bacterium]|nr:IPTL-CTERM sorting domain-containing protein [Thermoanaerobaculia bacterium]
MRMTDLGGREVVIRRGAASVAMKTAPRRQGTHANVTINSGPDTDAANNDYRRIQNAINAALPTDIITLSGTFDFTAPNAATAWALGNDNTASTADDYSVYVPAGLNDVTLTATSLGTATIQGPGDLAAVNLEGFLLFDGGDNQSWTISNLRILDFDLAIGMFSGAGGADAFNDTLIQNNFIRLAPDLNGTVAPADVNQNIGIHFSFGTNQSIIGNTIHISGNDVGDVVNNAAGVGMQSNTSGGAFYDGLTIAGNILHVLNAQNAIPETVLGIWENAHAHTSDITVFNNQFINDAAGNDPALNLQRGFRVTSHSSAGTTVTYDSNQVTGANIGFQWITGSNFAGNQAVVVTGNTVANCATGVLVQSDGVAHFNHNSITGSGAGGGIHVVTGTLTGSGANTNSIFRTFVTGGTGNGIWIEATAGSVATMSQNNLSGNTGFGLRNDSAPSILAERNWWGNNLAAPVAAEVSGNADFDPWLASGTDVSGLFGFQPFTYATTSGTITTFLGTGAADTGALLAGDPVTMQMNGDTAFTALAQLLNFDIQVGGSDDVFTLGQTGVPTIFDGGLGNDTLVGTNVAQTWNITGAGSGNIPGATSSFIGVESLRGGTAADSFVFGAAGSLAASLDGNLGIDTLNNTAIPAATVTPTGPGTLDGFMGTATGVGTTFDNINTIAGSPADLSVTKTGPANASTGTIISYTITVTNGGPNAAINVSLSDTLPAGTTFASLSSPGGWSCTTPAPNGTGTVNCTILSLAAGASVFTLNVNAVTPGIVTNIATVTSANEGAPGNESGNATTTVTGIADLTIVKSGPATATPGGQITYNIAVGNNGPDPATNVVVTDVLPAGVTFFSATPSQGSCSGTTTVTCNLGTIANGSSATIALIVTVTAPSGPIANTATADSTETDPSPASSTTTTSVVAAAIVPTLGEWALLAFAALLAMIALRMRV